MAQRLRPIKSKRQPLALARFLRYWYIRLARLQGHPQEIARGLALGVFAGWFPWFGLQMAIAVFFAILFRGNKLAAAASTWVSNPLTYVPIFAFNYKVGKWLLNSHNLLLEGRDLQIDPQSWSKFVQLGWEFMAAMFLGCFIVGAIVATVVYFFSLRLLRRWHQLRQLRK
jgi:uncharacterized protein (DUF2062 family)